MNAIVSNAERIARQAHQSEVRKWSAGEPVINHPLRVSAKVASLADMTDVDVAAAWLHDVIEDVAIPGKAEARYASMIRAECGDEVLSLVLELTNPTERPEWKYRPRAERRARDWEHLAIISDRAKRIKLVDRWDNLQGMRQAPLHLAQKYVPESRHLLDLCRHADPSMARELEERIEQLAAAIA